MQCYWQQRERCVGCHHLLGEFEGWMWILKLETHLSYLKVFSKMFICYLLYSHSAGQAVWVCVVCLQSHRSVCRIISQTSFSVSFPSPTGEPFLPAEYRPCSHHQAERHPQGRVQPVHESSESHPDSGATAWHRVCAVPMATRGPDRWGGVRLRDAHPHALPGGQQHTALLTCPEHGKVKRNDRAISVFKDLHPVVFDFSIRLLNFHLIAFPFSKERWPYIFSDLFLEIIYHV